MAFLVDIVSEDSFYVNLTLGLPIILSKNPYVKGVQLEKRLPCERVPLVTWEQRHNCTMPDDLKQFYLSTDGFRLRWDFIYGDEVLPVGYMKINPLSLLRCIQNKKNANDPHSPNLLEVEICSQQLGAPHPNRPRPNFGPKCKLFELDNCMDNGKVCLVYTDRSDSEPDRKREDPKIWLLDRSFDWHFLADNFTQYFRMMLVHQGLPQWQFRFTSMGPTPWAENIMMMVAPHLMQNEPSKVATTFDWVDVPNNHIDPSIFKAIAKNPKKRAESSRPKHRP